MELHEKQFITGFNSGYLLAKHEPKMLTDMLKNIQPSNSFVSGMSWGQKEFELEQSKSQMNELEKLRQKGRDENYRE
ncbi:MAG: hypothetical protein IPI45_07220 [Saprospiraceae bacterium]|nr:hypothetical protein [Saprospiraceae bacterium]MBK7737552.1 hypothetical protein [Saprospiraceae bacterium]MBK7913863.1 hypothetical protein [Saprospiraceae bacterium]